MLGKEGKKFFLPSSHDYTLIAVSLMAGLVVDYNFVKTDLELIPEWLHKFSFTLLPLVTLLLFALLTAKGIPIGFGSSAWSWLAWGVIMVTLYLKSLSFLFGELKEMEVKQIIGRER